MAGYVEAKTANTVPAGGPSPIIWADCPVVTILRDPGVGIHIFEDFEGGFITDEVASYKFALVGTNPDIDGVSDEKNGVVEIEGSGSANEEAFFVSNVGLYELKKNNGKKMWFEARLKFEDTDDDSCFLCGLGAPSLLAADCMTDDSTGSTTIADYDYVGFYASCDGTNMSDIDAVYHETGDGGTPTVVQADIVDFTAGATAKDDTYYRLGMKFDGRETVTFYLDGVAQTTKLDLDVFDTDDQLTEYLGVVLGIKNLAGTASFLAVDWIRFACEK